MRRGVDIYRGRKNYFGSKRLNCESSLHTFSGSSVIFDQCHMVWRAVTIKLQHVWICLSHSRGDEGNDITQFMSGDKELGLYWFLGGQTIQLRIN